jgi:hypothetical protein
MHVVAEGGVQEEEKRVGIGSRLKDPNSPTEHLHFSIAYNIASPLFELF